MRQYNLTLRARAATESRIIRRTLPSMMRVWRDSSCSNRAEELSKVNTVTYNTKFQPKKREVRHCREGVRDQHQAKRVGYMVAQQKRDPLSTRSIPRDFPLRQLKTLLRRLGSTPLLEPCHTKNPQPSTWFSNRSKPPGVNSPKCSGSRALAISTNRSGENCHSENGSSTFVGFPVGYCRTAVQRRVRSGGRCSLHLNIVSCG